MSLAFELDHSACFGCVSGLYVIVMSWNVFSQNIHWLLTAVPQTLLGKRVVADVIHQDEVIQKKGEPLTWYNWCLYKDKFRCRLKRREFDGKRDTQEDTIWGGGTDFLACDATTSQGMSAAARSWQKQGRIPVCRLQSVWANKWSCLHLDLRGLVSKTVEEYISVVLSYIVCGRQS